MSSQAMMMTQDDGVTDSLYQPEAKVNQQQQQKGQHHKIHVQARSCRLRFHWPHGFSYLAWKYRQWKWLHQSEFVWCFRPAIGGGDHHDDGHDSSPWKPFESKNQVILWQAYYNQPYQNQPSPYYECQVHDRAIDQGKQLVRIILHEHVAFTMDPDWSQPLVYEVAVCRVMRRSARTLWREWVLREKQTGPMYQ
ncbi:hypothetical protein BDB00DRAFT_817704 [Zychaea mexicana]|uniref:uncharacterized protein n=1 Tax=Zychaea mexicana TaxID=64656 RepID=UPI0022FEDD70|nr:uncharacterized protein BDB00DRAFT_817704 [Zychaea mexicana]KAI9494655.1 hypothetical protein BDB00DRAFT_817704 [Zychaea mexicana]